MKTLPETFDAFSKSIKNEITRLWKGYVEQGMFFVRKRCREVAETCDNNLVESLHRFLNCYFAKFHPTEIKPAKQFKEEVDALNEVIKPLFIFCYMWSVGGGVDGPTRGKFADYVWSAMQGTCPTEQQDDLVFYPIHSTDISKAGLPEGVDVNLYEYFFDVEKKCWVPWMETIPEFAVPRAADYENIIVPSMDSVRQTYVFKTLVTNDKHVLHPGPTGTGKSANMSLYLNKNAPDNFITVSVNFSAQTQANQLQDFIDSKIEKRRRGVYGPPSGKRMVIFADDLNMPQKEYYGAQPPIELLRQWMDHKGWYNRKELAFFEIHDLIMGSGMGPPGGGRTFISPRLKRHYNMVAYVDLAPASITSIFTVLTGHFLQAFPEEVLGILPKMVESMLKFFANSIDFLLPTPAKCHYLFNLRDVWRVFLGVCKLTPRQSGSTDVVTRCFLHEVDRVFGDRLIDDKDRGWLLKEKTTMVEGNFGLNYTELMTNENAERLVFGSFMTQEADNRVYEEIPNTKSMRDMIEEYLEEYNNVFPHPMRLSMFMTRARTSQKSVACSSSRTETAYSSESAGAAGKV
jgi:dynein heavy chain